jgi:hypothetical protein
MAQSFDVDPLMDIHPDDYARVAEFHAAQLSEEDKREMIGMFISAITTHVLDPDGEMKPEERGVSAFYSAYLFINMFHEIYDKTENHLATAKKLNNLLDK